MILETDGRRPTFAQWPSGQSPLRHSAITPKQTQSSIWIRTTDQLTKRPNDRNTSTTKARYKSKSDRMMIEWLCKSDISHIRQSQVSWLVGMICSENNKPISSSPTDLLLGDQPIRCKSDTVTVDGLATLEEIARWTCSNESRPLVDEIHARSTTTTTTIRTMLCRMSYKANLGTEENNSEHLPFHSSFPYQYNLLPTLTLSTYTNHTIGQLVSG